MAKLTLTEYIAEVKLIVRNVPTSDPWYAYFTKYVTRARNKIIRRAIELNGAVGLFPDLETSWTAGALVASGYDSTGIPHPSDAIAISKITCAHDDAVPDWTAIQEHPVSIVTRDTFAHLDKSATGYVQMAYRKANAWWLYPTPTAAYEDYCRLYGVREETPLAAGSDVFFSDDAWDDITVQKTAAMLFRVRGWAGRAGELEDAVEAEMQRTANIAALEQQGQVECMTVESAPTRSTIYLG